MTNTLSTRTRLYFVI